MSTDPVLLIPTPPFFSFQECIWFLNRNYDDCLHVINQTGIRKALEINSQIVLFEIREKEGFLVTEILVGEFTQQVSKYLTDYITEWFDMRRDLQPFYALIQENSNLNYMIDAYRGLRLIGISDLFEALCWSIIGQQINLTFAYKLKRRLVEKFGRYIEFENEVYYIFPKCEILATVQPGELREMQFSQKKAEYIIGIAGSFASGILSKEIVNALPDFESKQKMLMSNKGVGLWTANYSLMKSLRESAGIPYGDVGLLNALTSHGIIASRGEIEKIDRFFDTFTGWETYVVFYLWRSLAVR